MALNPESFSFPLISDMQRSSPGLKLYNSILEWLEDQMAAVWEETQVIRGWRKRRAGLACSACCLFTFCYFPNHPLGEGNGTPLQYSCLENPMDGGAWWAAVHGVSKSRTRLSDFIFTFMHWRRKWQPTPVFLPGESQGWGSLVGCRLWGRTESDTTEAT